MKFIDECVIKLCAGFGGDGHVDFDKKTGLPAGGNGGNGASIYFQGSKSENTLLNISARKEYFGENGQKGKYQGSSGKGGEDLILKVPLGTQVFVNDKLLFTVNDTEKHLIAKGGNGGRGNQLYLKHTKPKNYNYEKGFTGDIITCKLVLDILGDIGFVGKPSAGKSTILSVISNAKPKVAAYEFTTLKPQLGLVWVSKNKSFVAIDLPGLIARTTNRNEVESNTLKTISKCRAIAYVVDFGSENKDPVQDFNDLKQELDRYSHSLIKLPFIIIANKMDGDCFYDKLKQFKEIYPLLEIVKISALMKKNIKELKYKLFALI